MATATLTKSQEKKLREDGERLAVLLAAADMPSELKFAWAGALEYMDYRTLMRFLRFLESSVDLKEPPKELIEEVRKTIAKM